MILNRLRMEVLSDSCSLPLFFRSVQCDIQIDLRISCATDSSFVLVLLMRTTSMPFLASWNHHILWNIRFIQLCGRWNHSYYTNVTRLPYQLNDKHKHVDTYVILFICVFCCKVCLRIGNVTNFSRILLFGSK